MWKIEKISNMDKEEIIDCWESCNEDRLEWIERIRLLEDRNKSLEKENDFLQRNYNEQTYRFRSLDINSKGDWVIEDILQDMKKDWIEIWKIKDILEKHLIKPNP